jgi:membrane protease YdiL (CAAX protease family)
MARTTRNWLVWTLLVLVPAGWIGLDALGARHPTETETHAAAETLSPITVMQGRLAALLGGQALEPEAPLGTRPMARLASAMLLARAGQPDRALEQVKLASEAGSAAPAPELIDAVRSTVEAWSQSGTRGGRVSEAQWKELDAHMGWFAMLARADLAGDAADRTRVAGDQGRLMILIMMAGCWFLGVALMGLVLLVLLPCLAIAGRIRGAITPMPQVGTILGETFLVWMLALLTIRLVSSRFLDGEDSGAGQMWLSLAMTFASLFALAWAGFRGLRWSEFAEAAGLRWKGGAFRLCWMSATSYACALPCMGAGVLVGLALSALLADRSFQDVSHPVQEMLPGASPDKLAALFAIACVAAPVVEEIAFRGLLFGHARQGTGRWPKALSIAFAMLFSATVFAAIHPQGLLAVPALAGVSLGFCITREWSGSVVPGMLAHGLHNGVLLSLNLMLQP